MWPVQSSMALKTGIIDGQIAGAGGLKSKEYAEVLKSFVAEPTLTPIVLAGPTFNKDAWNALPDDIRNILLGQTRYFQAMAGEKYRTRNIIDAAWAIKNYGTERKDGSPTLTLGVEQSARIHNG